MRLSWQKMLLFLLLAVLIVLQRVRLYPAALHGDICAYALIGHEMRQGRLLYSDLWERKPPLLYATFAAMETITGYGKPEIFATGLITALATLGLIVTAGTSAGHGWKGGWLAGAFWALLNCDLDLAANQPDPEVFINLFLLAAVVLLLRWPRRWWLPASVALGVFFSAATLYKHNTALVVCALGAGHWLIPRPLRAGGPSLSESRTGRFMQSAIAALVVATVWVGMFAWFTHTGRRDIFIDVLFHQNANYSKDISRNFGEMVGLSRLLPGFMVWLMAPALLVAVRCLFHRRKNPDRSSASASRLGWWMLLAWVIGIVPTIAITGLIYPHYYELWLPIGCVAGGWAGQSLLRARPAIPAVFSRGAIALALMGLAIRQGDEFLLTPDQWTHQQFPYFDLPRQNQFGVTLGQILLPDETFWELGEDNALYFFARRDPPTGLLYIDPLIAGDPAERAYYWHRLMTDLDRSAPALVVLSDNWTGFFPPDAPIFAWIQQHYQPWTTPIGWPHYRLYIRKNSPLAHRAGF